MHLATEHGSLQVFEQKKTLLLRDGCSRGQKLEQLAKAFSVPSFIHSSTNGTNITNWHPSIISKQRRKTEQNQMGQTATKLVSSEPLGTSLLKPRTEHSRHATTVPLQQRAGSPCKDSHSSYFSSEHTQPHEHSSKVK